MAINVSLLLVLICLLKWCNGSDWPCESEVCQTWHTPIPNMASGLNGYDPIQADPFSDHDPGIKNQIFNPTDYHHGDDDRRIEVYGYIVKAEEDLRCSATVTTQRYRNFNEYYEKVTSSYSFASSDNENVNMALSIWSYDHSSATTSSGDNQGSKIRQFFEKTQGEMYVSEATCYTHSMDISSFAKPVFTDAFEYALTYLQIAAEKHAQDSTDQDAKDTFIAFVEDYGTHFMTEVRFGAKIIWESLYTQKSRGREDEISRLECNSESVVESNGGGFTTPDVDISAGAKGVEASTTIKGSSVNVGIGFSEQKANCDGGASSDKYFTDTGMQSSRIVSIGSTPQGTLEDWADTEFSPVPLKFELKNIGKLFKSEWITDITRVINNTPVTWNATQLLHYWEEMTKEYCEIVLRDDCIHLQNIMDKGCGISDLCTANQTCEDDPDSTFGHTCIEKPECGQEQYSGMYCAKSSSKNCDGSTCTQLGRDNGSGSVNECIDLCQQTANCQYISYTLAAKDCLLYDECPAGRAYSGSQSPPTSTIRVCGCGQEKHSGKYCAKSASENCDGTTCTQLGLSTYKKSIYECIEWCRGPNNAGCQYVSFSLSGGDTQCILYNECPAGRQHGWDQSTGGTSTIRVCDCHNVNCQNGGTCVISNNNPTCKCPPGYSGNKCQIVNCQWGAWTSWSGCSKTCDEGQMTRTRSKTVIEAGGGTCSGSSFETIKCNIKYCGACDKGYDDCCNDGQCTEGQGDCDGDSDCKGNLFCGDENCGWEFRKTISGICRDDDCEYAWDSADDCCTTRG